jgi:hypothetical protein
MTKMMHGSNNIHVAYMYGTASSMGPLLIWNVITLSDSLRRNDTEIRWIKFSKTTVKLRYSATVCSPQFLAVNRNTV